MISVQDIARWKPLWHTAQTVASWVLLVLVVLLSLYVAWAMVKGRRRSDTASFIAAVLSQLTRHRWVAVLVLVFSFILVVISHLTLIETAMAVTFFGAVATFVSLMNTYYIMHGMESRVYDYNNLIDRLSADLDSIAASKREPQDWNGEYLYILAYTPLLGSISADERKYDLYRDKLGQVVKNADTAFVRASDYQGFHEKYAHTLARFASDPAGLKRFVASRNRHVEQLLSLNEMSAGDGKQAFDRAAVPVDAFPPYYIYVSRNLTAICLVRREPRVGNEIVAIVSGEKFYREFARELFPADVRDELRRIEG